jgi:hypothetical protein
VSCRARPSLSQGAKIWLANQQADTYGGIYTWDDIAAMMARHGGKIFHELHADPHIIDVAVGDLSVLAGPRR